MTTSTAPAPRKARSPKSHTSGKSQGGEVVHTVAFDSVGPRKYALQIKKAGNGNPSLRIVEGVPQGDGTFRKFHLTIWSEDFDRFFEELDAMRAYMREHNIKTPPGHKYDPSRKSKFAKKRQSPR